MLINYKFRDAYEKAAIFFRLENLKKTESDRSVDRLCCRVRSKQWPCAVTFYFVTNAIRQASWLERNRQETWYSSDLNFAAPDAGKIKGQCVRGYAVGQRLMTRVKTSGRGVEWPLV
jgi:hypothetical protein